MRNGDLMSDAWYLYDMSIFCTPLRASMYLSISMMNGKTSRVLSFIIPSTLMLSICPSFLFLNRSLRARLLYMSLPVMDKSSPLILRIPFTLGMMRFMFVSNAAVAATSQFSSPWKDFSRGMIVSIEGIRLMTLSAVMSSKLRLNPALRSFFDLLE